MPQKNSGGAHHFRFRLLDLCIRFGKIISKVCEGFNSGATDNYPNHDFNPSYMGEYSQFTVKFTQLILRVRELRGQILDEVIFIEFVLDLIIMKYFCESTSKIELFQATLLNQEYISLDSKIKTFKNLNLGNNYQNVVRDLSFELRKAKDARNYFAHRMLDNSEEAVNNSQLRLIYYENGKKKYDPINEDYLNEKLSLLVNLRTDLVVLLMNADFARSLEIDIKV